MGMSYEQRDEANKKAAAMAADVAAAGERLGFWKIADHRDDGQTQRWLDVDAPDGQAALRFTISGGGWGREEKVSIGIASIRSGAFHVSAYDIRRYQEATIEASASVSRGAEAIAKDLNRRVVQNDAARDQARRVRQAMVNKLESAITLRQQVIKMEALGFTFPHLADDACGKAEPWSPYPGLRVKTVYASGDATVELNVSVDKLAVLIESLGLSR